MAARVPWQQLRPHRRRAYECTCGTVFVAGVMAGHRRQLGAARVPRCAKCLREYQRAQERARRQAASEVPPQASSTAVRFLLRGVL